MTADFPLAPGDPLHHRRRLRTQAIAAREALSAAQRAALTERIEGALDLLVADLAPSVLAFCWPHRGEPDLRAWVMRWLAVDARRRAALPVVLDKATPLVFRRWTPGEAMPLDLYGIPHPAAGEHLCPELLLVPLNAFDRKGYRLGYGGGYFDRTLAATRAVAVGVGFELGRAESVLPQPHDRAMDWIVTEAGAFRAPPR